jgi:Integrase core domain
MTKQRLSLLGALQVVQPETMLRWHRVGFKVFWRWKSRNRAGRAKIDCGLCDLIGRMNRENPRWGASRIHGELLMLGFDVAQSTSRNTWCEFGTRLLKPGRHFYEITPKRLPPLICALCRTSRVRAMGIGDQPISPGSPWQNGIAERLIGALRCECLDQIVIFGEAHLRRILSTYATYYNQARTHLALQKDAPLRRAVQRSGAIVAIPILAGLHHQYIRI